MSREYERHWLKKGTILHQKYEIKDVISEGGFGIVYLGYDQTLKIQVAIKEYFPRRLVTRGEGTNELYVYKGVGEENFKHGVDSFLEEARIMAQFHRLEGIVMVRDFFYENNTAYIVNEYIEGENAKEYINKNGKMDAMKVLKLMRPIIYSLGEIHKKGLLHRDIAPDNIILQEEKAILIDFGAARLCDIEEQYSMTVFFKRGYSAEEQYIRRGEQGTHTDIYAICATMYFMLTGIQPVESVQRHIQDSLLPLTKIKDVELSDRKKKAIMTGMEIAIDKRFSKVEELCRELYEKSSESSHKSLLYVSLISLGIFISIGTLFYKQKKETEIKQAESLITETPKTTDRVVATPSFVPSEKTFVLRMPKVTKISKKMQLRK